MVTPGDNVSISSFGKLVTINIGDSVAGGEGIGVSVDAVMLAGVSVTVTVPNVGDPGVPVVLAASIDIVGVSSVVISVGVEAAVGISEGSRCFRYHKRDPVAGENNTLKEGHRREVQMRTTR